MSNRRGVCSIATCTAGKTRNTISYYSFPKNLEVRKEWVRVCKRKNYVNPNTARICSVHFRETDYVRDLQAELLGYTPRRKLLKEGTVPSLNLPGQSLKLNPDINLPLQKVTNDFSLTPVSDSCDATSARENRALKRDIRKRALDRISKLSPKREKIDIESKVGIVKNESYSLASPINCNEDINTDNSIHTTSVLGIHLTPLEANRVPKQIKISSTKQFNKVEPKEKTVDSDSKADFVINESSFNSVCDSTIYNSDTITNVSSFSSVSKSVNCASAIDIQAKPLEVNSVSKQKIKKAMEQFHKIAPKMTTMDSNCIILLQGVTVPNLNLPEQSAVLRKEGSVPLNIFEHSLKSSPNTSIPLQEMITNSSVSLNAVCNSGSSESVLNNVDAELQIHATLLKENKVLKCQSKEHPIDQDSKLMRKRKKLDTDSNLHIIPKKSTAISNSANYNIGIVANDSSFGSIQDSASSTSILNSIHAKSPLETSRNSEQNVRKCAMEQLVKISPKWREVYSNSKGNFLKKNCLNCSKTEREFFYRSLRYKRHVTSMRKRNSVLLKQIKNLKSQFKYKEYTVRHVKNEMEVHINDFNYQNSVADSASCISAVDIHSTPFVASTISKQNINKYSVEQNKRISAEVEKVVSNSNAKLKNDCLNCSVMKRQIFSDSLRRKSLSVRTKKRITMLENGISTVLKENKDLKAQLEKKNDCIAARVQEEIKKVFTGILTKQQMQCLANGEKKDFHQIMLIDPLKKNILSS